MEPEKGPEPKRRKIHKPPPRRTVSSPSSKTPKDAKSSSSSKIPKDAKSRSSLMVPGSQTSAISFRIQQAKTFAVAQAKQDGCTGNFKKFDSQYGNFLVPVVPSRAELTG